MSKELIMAPRELLERISTGMWYSGDRKSLSVEIEALLAQPNTCTKDGGQCEPVGYAQTSDLSRLRTVPRAISAGVLVRVSPKEGYVPLYRHPPAQVPVVLPEFKSWYAKNIGVLGTLACKKDELIWSAYDDELKRLNPGIEP